MPWEDLKPMFRPETVHMGVLTVDAEKCTHCGLCMENCPLRAWETDENEVPRQKKEYECFSCCNCMVVCPVDAITLVDGYHVDRGFYETDPHPLPYKMPLKPLNADGKPDEWNAVERLVLERRSVRNFKDKPVPEPLIRRVLEAGRFAPSAGNCQPWKFIVITNLSLIKEMEQLIYFVLAMLHNMYKDDGTVQNLVPMYEAGGTPGSYDPRVILGGIGSIVKGNGTAFLGAPAVVLLLGDKRAIGGPLLNIGICGQNMNIVAKSLGLAFCWVGFSTVLMRMPPLLEKLGVQEPWEITNSFVLGYPRFKQEGMVPREYRPVTWFRNGSDSPQVEE
ncbi:MAG: nitroreductase family protein [Dehalococcoidia bacterium]|nr:nitroreductase family protein [Dehalococcoidia bacterium]